jgi:hypothetical protein
MLEWLAHQFVGRPLTIFGVAWALVVAHLLLRWAGRPSRALLASAAAWTAYAAWEWLVVTRTPEANIRVDLMLIWPGLAIVTAWCGVKALRGA